MSIERAAYWMARTVIAMAGLFCLFVAFLPILLQAEIVLQILGIGLALPLAALMLCPNRLTVAGRRFKYRLVASIFIGLWLIVAGFGAISMGLDGEHDPRVWISVPIDFLLGFSLPGCLWWRSSLAARKGTKKYQEL